MKSKLIFNLPEEQEEFENAVNGGKYKNTIDEIWNRVFRPAFKHGYSGQHAKRLNELLESDSQDGTIASEVINMLADIYRDVVRDE